MGAILSVPTGAMGKRAELRGWLEIKDASPFDKDIVVRHAWSAHLLRRLSA